MVYQPKGRQVSLAGGPVSVGFEPVRAADRSGIVQQAGQQRLNNFIQASEVYTENLQNNVDVLSQFSETLNKFIFEQAKSHNENEFKLGLASVLNGDLKPRPELLQQYHDQAAMLEQGVDEEIQVIDRVAESSPGAALQRQADSPALTGWQAYGAAVGKAKLAASSAQAVMSELMASDNPIVPIVGPDGQVRMMAPSEARSPAEWQAAWATNLQMFIDQAGLANLNPIILAEELTPQMMAVKSNLFTNQMAQVRKMMQEEAVERATINIAQNTDLIDVTNPDAVSLFWQQTSADMRRGTGMSRGEANAKAVELILSRAQVTRNEELLDALANTPLIADQPNGVTLGQMYGPQFESVSSFIREDRERVRQEAEREMDEAVEGISTELTLGLLNAQTPEETAQVRQAASAALRQLAGMGNAKAAAALFDLESQDANYNPLRAQDIARDLRADPFSHSQATIREELRRGNINAEEARQLENLLPSSAAREDAKELYPMIDRLSKGVFAGIFADEGITSTDAASLTAVYEAQFSDELKDLLLQFYQENPNASKANARDYITQKANAMQNDPRFRPQIKDGKIVPSQQLSRGGFRIPVFKNPATGADTRDFTVVPPAQIRSSRPQATRDYLLSPAELSKAQEDIMNGRQPTGRIAQVMQATGLPVDQLIRSQAKAYGVPLAPNLEQSTSITASRQRSILAPSAAALLNNPNASRLQRIRAWADIGMAKERAARRQQEASSGPDLQPGQTVGMSDYLRLGYANGLRGNELIEFAAIGMAESSGRSGAVNNAPEAGGLAYGLWQINMFGDLGPERLRQFGLRSADDLKDPETNARAAVKIWKSSGKGAWEAYRMGMHRQYIADAAKAYYDLQRSGGFSGAGRGGGRSANMTPRNIQSITFDTGQPGLDLWFADKNFGAVLPGRVKEISNQTGPGNTGYGNYIVVESIDPATGQKVDVLYAHLDNVNVREGDRIRPGQVIGRQGGTGRVSSVDGTIASIDFLAPAPRGSKSMTPYSDYDRLRRRIAQQIQSGQFR